MRKFKVKGLVTTAKWVHEKLATGVAPDRRDEFIRVVTNTLATIERQCADLHATPDDLHAASRQAYWFLKTLDMKNLPLRAPSQAAASPQTAAPSQTVTPPPKPAAPTLRVKNLIRNTKWIHESIERFVEMPASDAMESPEVAYLLDRITSDIDIIDKICADAGTSPAVLPKPSRQAYQWLRFLSDRDNFAAHLATVGAMSQLLHNDRDLVNRVRARKVHIEMSYFGMLYVIKSTGTTINIKVSEGYCAAPPEMLHALCDALLIPELEGAVDLAVAYGNSDDFVEIIEELEALVDSPPDQQRGQYYDLNVVFERVNQLHFNGQVKRPRLTWSALRTTRKMGHYRFSTDTVMISLTLDQARVPPYAIDFVMYHELLHKQMGTQVVNGRRYSHTPAFRAAERRYPQYAEANAIFAKLGSSR